MAWRAAVRFVNAIGEEPTFPWRKFSAALGTFLFIVSDGWLGYVKFMNPLPNWRELVMVNYYTGQYLISLSVPQDDSEARLEERKKV